MSIDISRRAGRAMGLVLPAPTPEQRKTVIDGIAGAQTWGDVTPAARALIERFEQLQQRPGRG